MKKLLLIITTFVLTIGVFAQRIEVQNASNYSRNNDLEKAIESAEKATTHTETAKDSKAWYLKGTILMKLDDMYSMVVAAKEGLTEKELNEKYAPLNPTDPNTPLKPESKRKIKNDDGSKSQKCTYLYDVVVIFDPDGKLELASKKKDAIKAEKFEEANMIKNEENKINAEIEEIWKKIKLEKQTSPTIVDSNDIAQVISSMTGVPINKISFSETEKLINLEKTLKEKIIGQDYAINKISKAIRRNRTGLKDPEKPIGVFIFLGPTGVGKTYLAKTIAELMFGSADSLIRVDMGEYNEKFSVSRLIGSPPGYVGYEEGGQLTEKVKQKPYSVVLLDEIEKAHNDIFNVLLHTLDYGFMTDGLGRKIDFRNTIIIMTSNIGSREAMEFGGGIGFSIQDQTEIDEKSKTIIEKKLKKTFAPEFINRIDEIITFNSLTKDNIKDILKIEINYLADRMKEINIELKVDDSLLNHIINHEWNLKYGARPVHRALMNYIEDPIADAIISKNPTNKPATIIVKFNKETNKSEVELTVKD
jgi:ATP-dependent Clp protease ATP-binding subunit ClpC